MSKVLIGNIKGPAGADGTSGIDGVSPTVEVASNTDSEYVLKITSKDGVIVTPNLKGAGGTGGTVEYGELTFPLAFPSIPFTFYRDVDGEIRHTLSFGQYKNGYTEIYASGTSGSDGTGDGSSSKPFATVQKAMDTAEAGSDSNYIIKVGNTTFNRTHSQVEKTITKNISIVGTGDTKTILASRETSLTWTEDGTGTWKATRSSVYSVFDLIEKDTHNEPTPYDNVLTLAECQAGAGSWYTDETTVWVHTLSGEMPTTATHAICLNVNLCKITISNDATLYFENLRFIAGRANNGVNILGDGTVEGTFITNNCSYLGSNLRDTGSTTKLGNALAVQDVKNTYNFNCVAAYSGRDGFNYHFETLRAQEATKDRTRECLVVEYKGLSYNHGIYSKSGADNATTCHEGACIIRIGSEGYNSAGPVLHDTMGCLSYMVDCKMRDSVYSGSTAARKAAYFFDGELSAEEGSAWLINCSASGGNYSLSGAEGYKVYLKNFSGDNILPGLNISYLS